MLSQRMRCLSFLVAFLGLATSVSAQNVSSGRITGTITDETGLALPGVTVTATSPALLLPQILAVSGDRGEYQFVDVPPGTYGVTYELPGFASLVREGIRITARFEARVNVTLGLSTLTETITVSGESPLVDIANTRGGASVSKDLLASTPNNLNYQDLYLHVSGVQVQGPPLTGQSGSGPMGAQARPKTYGHSGVRSFYTIEGIGAEPNEAPDLASVDEVNVQTFGTTAEIGQPGVSSQLIVKSGGNQFTGRYTERFMHSRLQSSNIDAALMAQNIREGNSIRYYNQLTADLGGPIVEDRAWFYVAFHDLRNERNAPGYSSGRGPDGVYGTADDIPGVLPGTTNNQTAKVTYQANTNHKLIGFWTRASAVDDGAGASRFTPEESTWRQLQPGYQGKAEWQGVFSNDLYAHAMYAETQIRGDRAVQPSSRLIPNRFDRESGFQTGGSFHPNIGYRAPRRRIANGSVNYFPRGSYAGSHEIVAGYALMWGVFDTAFPAQPNGNYRLVYDNVGGLSGRPVEFHAHDFPVAGASNQNLFVGYVSDSWRPSDRMTVNLGLRFERNDTYVGAQVKEQGQFGTAGSFPRVDVGTWNAFAPRLGVAYDLSGNGKTVLKATYGIYNHDWGYSFAHTYNQNNVSTISYLWNDPDGNDDYTPGEVDLDPNGADFLNATGASNNVINPDLELTRTHEVSVSLEQELAGAFSVRALYLYKRVAGDIATVNILRPPEVYNQVLTRRDPGPDGLLDTGDDGGLVNVYDYDPAFRGSDFVGNQITNSDLDHTFQNVEFMLNRRQTGRWHATTSFLLTKNHRFGAASPFGGGLVRQSPNDDYFPLDETWDYAYRLAAAYQLPADVNFGLLYQAYRGQGGQRTYRFGRVDPDGGPSLPSSGSVNLRVEPFGERRENLRHIMNFRFGKAFEAGPGRLGVELDILNAFNENMSWGIFGFNGVTYASGPSFGFVTNIVAPRAVRLGMTYEF